MGDAPRTEVAGHEVDAGAQSPSPARAREAADEKRAELTRRAEDLLRELGGAPGPRQRFWFILEARRDDLYVRGESSALLAGIWLLSTNTVEQTACDVHNALTDPTNLERAREDIVWTARRRSDELYERSKGAADRDAAPLAQAAGAALDQYGKASGAIQQGPQVNVWVDARGQVRPEFRTIFVAACEVAASMGLDPRAYHAGLGGKLATVLPSDALASLPAPAALSADMRARALLPAMLEVWAEVEDATDLLPGLRLMAGANDE
jgi:hypothetical protein